MYQIVTSPVNLSDIVVSSYVFPDEIHNEDAHYSRLAIEFFQEKMNVKYHFVLIILN